MAFANYIRIIKYMFWNVQTKLDKVQYNKHSNKKYLGCSLFTSFH